MRGPLFCLLLLACAATAGPVRAEPRLALAGSVFRAGDWVEVAWSGLPADAREVELELSVAAGAWVRVSPELDARTGRYVGRLPDGVAGDARLRLRWGSDREEFEGEPVELELRAPDGTTPWAAAETWWFTHPAAMPREGALHGRTPVLAANEEAAAGPVAPEALHAPPPLMRTLAPRRVAPAPAHEAAARHFAAPRAVPRRI